MRKTIAAGVILFAVGAFFLFGGSRSQAPSGDAFTVTLAVSAETLLENMHLLSEYRHRLVPDDGIIFPPTEVFAHDGESVFDVLNREMRNAGIHMVFRQMPVFGSVYIEGINNIFEFDAGGLSGWKYQVNGDFPGVGASAFILQEGDFIEWLFTVDLGRDLGYE
ncbi:MAG: DUF4430 domain-containing protein [Defluviitaleaceae bacterium]|nr:DUF4430 domain-containing protein [Defluviitaleaceae bacterium]